MKSSVRQAVRQAWLAVLFLVPVLGGAPMVAAADLSAQAPFEVARYTGGLFRALAVDDSYVYVGIGSRIGVVTHVNGEQPPLLVSVSLPLPEPINGLAVLAEDAVVAAGKSTLYVVSTSGGQRPLLAGEFRLEGRLMSLTSSGPLCYVLGEQELHVLRQNDQGGLEEVSRLLLPLPKKRATEVVVGEGLVFIGAGVGTVLVIDVSHPSAPAIVGGIEDEVLPGMLAAVGRRLYFLDGTVRFDALGIRVSTGAWLYTLEVREIDGQLHLATFGPVNIVPPTPGGFHPTKLVVIGAHIFIDGWSTGPDGFRSQQELRCWDVTEPDRPAPVSVVIHSAAAESVVAHGNELYFGATSGMVGGGAYRSPEVTFASVKDARAPVWIGHWQFGEPGRVTSVATSGQDFVFNESGGNTQIYDGGRPEELVSVSYLVMEDTGLAGVGRMVASPTRLYTLAASVSVFDIADREQPTKMAQGERLKTGEVLPVMAVHEPYVFVADGGFSVMPPAEPGYKLVAFRCGAQDTPVLQRVAEVVIGTFLDAIAVDAKWVYVVYREYRDGPGLLAFVDWSDPTLPVIVRRLAMPDGVSAKRVIVRDGYVYVLAKVTSGSGAISTGLFVLDASDMDSVEIVGQVTAARIGSAYEPPTRGQQYVLELIGSYALIAGHEPVVRAIDISDPRAPVEVQDIPVSSLVSDLAATEQHAYVVLEDGESLILRRVGGPGGGSTGSLYLPMVAVRR